MTDLVPYKPKRGEENVSLVPNYLVNHTTTLKGMILSSLSSVALPSSDFPDIPVDT